MVPHSCSLDGKWYIKDRLVDLRHTFGRKRKGNPSKPSGQGLSIEKYLDMAFFATAYQQLDVDEGTKVHRERAVELTMEGNRLLISCACDVAFP
jgi:hypothetical protein